MAASWHVSHHGTPIGVVDATTRFVPISGYINGFTTEANADSIVRDAGVFDKASVYVTANDCTNSSTVTLRKSAADTAVVITVGAGATGLVEDTSNTATFASTDTVCWEVTVPTEAGTHTLTMATFGVRFTPTNAADCVSMMAAHHNANIATASVNRFIGLNGQWNALTAEAAAKTRIRFDNTAKNFYGYFPANARTTSTVFKMRKNGADGAGTFTVGAGATGLFEDTSNTDTFAAGDDANYLWTTSTGTENLNINVLGVTLVSTARKFQMLCGQGSTVNVAFNTTTYCSPSAVTTFNTTEAQSALAPHFEFTASDMWVLIAANTIATSNSTVTLRDNGGDSAVTFTIGAGATGLFEDTSNTALISLGDEVAFKVVTPNTSGNLGFTQLGFTGTVPQTQAPRTMHSERMRRAA